MTQMVTRCPKCATAFRITSTQLESAKGAVRCGSCLHIFKAQDYLVKSANEAVVDKTPISNAPASNTITNNAPTNNISTTNAVINNSPAANSPINKVSASEAIKPNVSTPAPKKPVQVIPPEQATQPKQAVALEQKPINPIRSAIVVPSTPYISSTPKIEKPNINAKPIIDKASVLADEEDVLISDDMDNVDERSSIYEFDGFIDLDMTPKQTVSLFEREIRYESLNEDTNTAHEDESWAEELLDDHDQTAPQLKISAFSLPSDNDVAHVDNKNNHDNETEIDSELNEPDYQLPISSNDDAAPEKKQHYSAPIFSLIDDPQINESQESAFSDAFLNATRPPPTSSNTHRESAAFAAELFEQHPDSSPEDDKPNTKRPVKSSSKMRAFDTSRAALLMNIMPAPVEFTAKRMRRWYQRKLWPTLVIVMLMLLLIQISYFKFDYFSRVEPYRTAYLFVCPVIGCKVPALVDVSQVQIRQLTVRSHPEKAGALKVEAIILNTAPFDQPFPELILSFSKIDDTPIVTRVFKPHEYLGGELAGATLIPQQQPVHIVLDIADPGPEAVNYTLTTH